MSHPIEFSVTGFVAGISELLHVIGRCGDTPLNLGDEFEAVYDYSYRAQPDGREIAEPLNIIPVRLKIVSIHAYQSELIDLGSGMTGRLSLSGTGIDLVRPRCVLGSPIPAVGNEPIMFPATTSLASVSSDPVRA